MRNAMRMLALGVLAFGIAIPASAGDTAGGKLFSGCLTGTDDNYILRAEDGTLYRLHSDKDLDEHVGHTVQVKGSVEDKRREQEAQASSGASQQAGVEVPTKGINVDDIKSLANNCQTAGSGASPSSAMSSPNPDMSAQAGTTTQQSTNPNTNEAWSTPSSGQAATTASGAAASAANAAAFAVGSEHWIEGCMVGTDDYYVMRDQNGTLFRLHSDKDLDEHVGHVVRVKGKVEQNSREYQAQRVVDAARVADIDLPTVGINVNDVKTVANSCQR